MYLLYITILLLLILILVITLKEEIRIRRGIVQGMANKYWMLREKRKFVRFHEDMKVRYSRVYSDPNFDNIKMKNISRKGLCISTYEKLKVKDVLQIEVDIPGFSKPVKLIGSVVWIKELLSPDMFGRRIFYTGIKFSDIRPESEAVLITHLNTLIRP